MAVISPALTLMPIGYCPASRAAWMRSPVEERVLPMRLTITSRLSKGWPRQFAVIWQNMRCSILFHLLVPGGRWLTAIRSPVSSASRCSSAVHRRARALLLPPPSAVMSRSVARGDMDEPLAPPRPDCRYCKRGGIMVHAHADPPEVGADVVGAVGDGLAELLIDEVIPTDLGRMPRGVPLTARILARPPELRPLGIHRYDGRAAPLTALQP